MTVTLELSTDVCERLNAEAARRGISVEALIAELAENLPAEDPLEAFIGSGSSGRGHLGRRHREIRAEETSGSAARDS